MTPASPIGEAFAALRTLNASWHVEIGRPEGSGWIHIGQRAKTRDRKTIAASFA